MECTRTLQQMTITYQESRIDRAIKNKLVKLFSKITVRLHPILFVRLICLTLPVRLCANQTDSAKTISSYKYRQMKDNQIISSAVHIVILLFKCHHENSPIYFYPQKPHFYIIKLGFTGVYIIFLIFAQNIDCGYSLEPPRRGGSNEYPQSMF